MRFKQSNTNSLYCTGVKLFQVLFVLVFIFSLLGVRPAGEVLAEEGETTFAVITDFGYANNTTVANVADMVNSWNPEFIVTAGDNSQGTTCDTTCYQGVVGAYYGPQASPGRTDFMTEDNFYPVPGNHDYYAAGTGTLGNYLAYFTSLITLPPSGASTGATNRYYDFVRGPVHFFMLDSGQSDNSAMPDQALQQTFLENGLANSTAAWQIVMFHRPPYTSSSFHSSDTNLQWPFEAWGADFVITGHNHVYERIYKDEGDLRYITAGTAGSDTRSGNSSFAGLEAYYFTGESGAIKVVASDTNIELQYITTNGTTETIRDTFERTTVAPTDPAITTSETSLGTFSTLVGLPSGAKTFTVSGVRLKSNIAITAPDGFEVSSNGSDYSDGLSLTQTDGVVGTTTISARMTGEDGSFSGDISLSSTDAPTKLVAVSGTTGITTTASFQEGVDGYTGMIDTYIHQDDPTFNYGNSTPLMVDSDDPYNSGNDVSALLRWDLSSIPVGSMIESASITVYVEDVTESPGYSVYQMNQSWLEGTGSGSATGNGATWNTYNGVDAWPNGAGGAGDKGSTTLATFAQTSTGTSTVSLNAAAVSVLQGWINSPASNHGLMIHAGDTANGLDITSSEGTTTANRPKLTLTYSLPSDDPIIIPSVASLPAFSALPGAASTVSSYTVQAVNLEDDLEITAPTDFQISTSSTTGFGQSLTLVPVSGGITSTTIYVKFSRATEGTSSGVISHVSSPAATKDVAVTGTAALTPPWTAYNDMSGTSTPANTTEFTLGQTNGMLKDFDTGDNTGVTVTVTSAGSPYDYTSGGQMPASGTDAYAVFNGKVDLQGVIMSATSNPTDYYVDVTFNNLDPDKTYTFVTTANRAGGTGGDGVPYTQRETRYTISGTDAATNDSSDGVDVINESSVYFVTGENTAAGYVAKWVNIEPGADGSFTVTAQPQDAAEPRTYTFGGFMLQEEVSGTPDIEITSVAVSNIDVPAALGKPDTEATIAATPAAGITSTTAAVTWDPDENPFDYSTVYTASVSLTAASGYEFTSDTTATVNGQEADVVLNGDGTVTISFTYEMTEDEPVVYEIYLPLILK